MKNFLKEYTLSKIQIIKNDPNKWKPLLLNVIEADQLPKHWGGTMVDPDGDARCPTTVWYLLLKELFINIIIQAKFK